MRLDHMVAIGSIDGGLHTLRSIEKYAEMSGERNAEGSISWPRQDRQMWGCCTGDGIRLLWDKVEVKRHMGVRTPVQTKRRI